MKDFIKIGTTSVGGVVIPLPPVIRQVAGYPVSDIVIEYGREVEIPIELFEWIKANTNFWKKKLIYAVGEKNDVDKESLRKIVRGPIARLRKFVYENKDNDVLLNSLLDIAEQEDRESAIRELTYYKMVKAAGMPVDLETRSWGEIKDYWNSRWGSFDKIRSAHGDGLKGKREAIRIILMRRLGIKWRI